MVSYTRQVIMLTAPIPERRISNDLQMAESRGRRRSRFLTDPYMDPWMWIRTATFLWVLGFKAPAHFDVNAQVTHRTVVRRQPLTEIPLSISVAPSSIPAR